MTDNDLQGSIALFGEAWAQGDLATLESLLSKTYTHIDVFGMFHDRAAWLRYVGGRTGRATQIGFREVETRVLGDVAVVTGVNDVTGPGASTDALAGISNPAGKIGFRSRSTAEIACRSSTCDSMWCSRRKSCSA